MAILTAGAYGAVMASAYNARPPAPEVLVAGDEWGIVRARQDHDDLIAQDKLPLAGRPLREGLDRRIAWRAPSSATERVLPALWPATGFAGFIWPPRCSACSP